MGSKNGLKAAPMDFIWRLYKVEHGGARGANWNVLGEAL